MKNKFAFFFHVEFSIDFIWSIFSGVSLLCYKDPEGYG